jgi:hypothetical protein
MRIATWNLNRCPFGSSTRCIKLLEWMERIDADVWVLTETYRTFTPGSHYRLIDHSDDAPDRDANQGECWTAVWSRLPAEPVNLCADRERVAAARVGKTVVVGTVMPWLCDGRNSKLRGTVAFRARLAEQAADWTRLRNQPCALCVAGDFNQDLLLSGHYYGSARGRELLRATLSQARLECLTAGADDPLADSPGLACIDHICIGGLRAVGRPRSSAWPVPGKLPRGLTDHYGVWADVEGVLAGIG